VYFIVRNKEEHPEVRREYTEENPAYRRTFHETREKLKGRHPKELALERRRAIAGTRYFHKDPESIARAAAIRDLMEHEIND